MEELNLKFCPIDNSKLDRLRERWFCLKCNSSYSDKELIILQKLYDIEQSISDKLHKELHRFGKWVAFCFIVVGIMVVIFNIINFIFLKIK